MKGIKKLLLGVFMLSMVVLAACGSKAYRTVVVTNLNGSPLVNNEAAYSGMHLVTGDNVDVPGASDMTLFLDNDKHVYAYENTKFSLVADGKEGSTKTVIKLEEGSVLNEIDNKLGDKESYQVDTPTATMSVRGTKFTVTVYAEGGVTYTEVSVTEGTVVAELKNSDGSFNGLTKTLEAGDSAVIRASEGVTEFLDEEAIASLKGGNNGGNSGGGYDGPRAENLDFLDGYNVLYADNGVILVKQDNLAGAFDYEGNMIVPCSYNVSAGYYAATKSGYFVFTDRIEGEEMPDNILFDRYGNAQYMSGAIVPRDDYYILVRTYDEYLDDSADYYCYYGPVSEEYYEYGSDTPFLVTDIAAVESYNRISHYSCGANGGKTIVYSLVAEDGKAAWDMPFKFGYFENNGEVTWGPLMNSVPNGYYPSFRPLGASSNGYFMAIDDSYNMDRELVLFDENTLAPAYVLEIGDPFSGYTWGDVVRYTVGNATFYNYGTKLVLKPFLTGTNEVVGETDGEDLVDIASGFPVVLAHYDAIYMNNEKYWLVHSGDRWGYIDHEGLELGMYADAASFRNGYGYIKNDAGVICCINENFEVVEEYGSFNSVSVNGDIVVMKGDDGVKCIFAR